jgi:putative hydrolase of the HAD superfamily
MTVTPDIVLFDLGGVLVELGVPEDVGLFAGEDDLDAVWRRWLACPVVRGYETGLITTHEFARRMVADYGLDVSPDAFLDAYRLWPRGLFPGAEELLGDFRPGVRYGCFSNTCEIHWQRLNAAHRLDELFETRFLSFQMGAVKPDREAFEKVAKSLDAEPGRILFLEDNPVNVEGAAAAGFDVRLVRGVAESRALLAGLGLLKAA